MAYDLLKMMLNKMADFTATFRQLSEVCEYIRIIAFYHFKPYYESKEYIIICSL